MSTLRERACRSLLNFERSRSLAVHNVRSMAQRLTAQQRQQWLVSAPVDIGLVFVLGGLWSAAAAVSLWAGTGFLIVAALFAVFADFPHVVQTSLRVWFDPAERARHSRHYLVSLLIIAAGVGSLTATGNFVIVIAVFLCWQVFHVIKQHIGMVSIYAAKAGYRGSRVLAKRVLILACAAPVVYRVGEGLHFPEYVFNGTHLPFSGMSLWLPPVPAPLVWLAYAAAAIAVAAFAREQITLRLRGEPTLPSAALLTMCVAVVFYNASYILVSDPYALTLIATTFHSLQYHLISWARNRGRFADVRADERRLLLARLSQPRSLLVLGALLVAVSALLSTGELVLLGVIPFTVVLHHFYLDGHLWKAKSNPGLAADLSLAVPKAHQKL